MADGINKWLPWIIIGLVVWQIYGGQQATPQATLGGNTASSGTGLAITHVTEDTTFTLSGVNKYAIGTKITTEHARVYVSNTNGMTDQGYVSLNSGTFTATPVNDAVRIYFYENSSTYYTERVDVAQVPDAGTVRKEGKGVTYSTAATFTYYNDDDTPNTAQAISNSQVKTLAIKYEAENDKAIGNPYAPADKNFVYVCLDINTTAWSTVKMPELTMVDGVPNTIAILNSSSFSWACYKGARVEDGTSQKYKVEVTAQNKDNGVGNQITYCIEDQDYTINSITGDEIYGAVDNTLTGLGMTAQCSKLTFS